MAGRAVKVGNRLTRKFPGNLFTTDERSGRGYEVTVKNENLLTADDTDKRR